LHPKLFSALGIHPHNAQEADEKQFERIENLAEAEYVVGIGETGLDYYYDFAPRDMQKKVFRKHLQIAKELKKPVIVHNRESDNDLIDIIRQEQDGSLRGVLHCFSSPADTLKMAIDLGFHVSFTGNITFKNTNLGDIVQEAPLNRIMLETDSPYMTPVPFRGKRNEPRLVKLIAQKISEYKSIPIQEVISMTTGNAQKLFNLTIAALLFLTIFSGAFAQDDTEYTEDEIPPEEEFVNPYKKTIGIGPYIGFNTIVETAYLESGERPDSYEGLIAFGGALAYSPLDFLIIEAAYVYSKNNKIAEKWNYLVEPSSYQVVELTSRWISNPYNRINIFATAGASIVFSSLGGPYGTTDERMDMGINVGVGASGNINTGAGLITPTFEWRLTFVFGRTDGLDPRKDPADPSNTIFVPYEKTTFFSIPRIGVIWYPAL
jgi:TatD DNase family protein